MQKKLEMEADVAMAVTEGETRPLDVCKVFGGDGPGSAVPSNAVQCQAVAVQCQTHLPCPKVLSK